MAAVDLTTDLEILSTWIGRTVESVDSLSVDRYRRLAQTFDRPDVLVAGDPVAPLGHFIAHLPAVATADLGVDGHPQRGGFLPPVGLPRRMWAGGRFRFHGDLCVGDEVTKRSTIDNVEMKQGRSGQLCFVTVTHELYVGGELRIAEQQDLVYRDDPAPDSPTPQPKSAPVDADFTQTITPTETLLFRYSALTFNSHRIHYDRTYAEQVEGYPALVVHGPLTATLLADLAVAQTGRPLATFSFRSAAPLFVDAPFTIAGTQAGDSVELWAASPDGGLAMAATATLRTSPER